MKVLVVGGGASGMMAAIIARKQGAKVMIVERNPRIGKKILATGNGRCNFTNIHADIDYYHGNNTKFIYSSLAQFDVHRTIDFFERLGIVHKIEEAGKVFPFSDQASNIIDVLLYEIRQKGIEIICDAFVNDIFYGDHGFSLKLEGGGSIEGDRVIITTGGRAAPSTGSDGNGFSLAKKMGHSLTDIFPSLVQIMLEGGFFNRIQGVKFVGTAEIIVDDKTLIKDRGDILFGNYGVSGPPILQLSRKAGEHIAKGDEVFLKLSIIDNMSKKDVSIFLDNRFKEATGKSVEFSLVGLINKRLIPVLLKEAKIKDPKAPIQSITMEEQERIADIVTDWRFKVRGTKGWSSAQVTAGGVDTRGIAPNTMESKIVKGLYFAGEVLDVDGMCGGFNLQWAWSSGFVAGSNAGTI